VRGKLVRLLLRGPELGLASTTGAGALLATTTVATASTIDEEFDPPPQETRAVSGATFKVGFLLRRFIALTLLKRDVDPS